MNTFTEKIGIVNNTISYMQDADNQAALKAKNFDVAPHITRLTAELGSVNTLAPVQKKMEVAHIKATSDLNDASYGAYNDASGVIDAMAGLLGKGTPAAKKLQEHPQQGAEAQRRQSAHADPAGDGSGGGGSSGKVASYWY